MKSQNKTPKKPIAKIDSMIVGGTKRSIPEVSKAVSNLNKSNNAKSFVKGVSVTNPISSSRTLSAKSSTSDVVNKMIDGSKKKPNLISKKK